MSTVTTLDEPSTFTVEELEDVRQKMVAYFEGKNDPERAEIARSASPNILIALGGKHGFNIVLPDEVPGTTQNLEGIVRSMTSLFKPVMAHVRTLGEGLRVRAEFDTMLAQKGLDYASQRIIEDRLAPIFEVQK